MNAIKAREFHDEPVTDEVLARAVEAGRERRATTPLAQQVRYLPEFAALAIVFADDVAILLPVKNYAEFAELTAAELGQVTLGFGGSALCLDARHLHIAIAGLVAASEPLMTLAASMVATRNGSRSSSAKTEAARANGLKGGRPRKVASAA